jgi:hypothetical protein
MRISSAGFGVGALVGLTLVGCASHERVNPCAAGETFVGGACVSDCALDVAAIEASLDPSVTVVQRFCVELPDGPMGAGMRADGSLELFHLHVASEGRVATMTLDRLGAGDVSGSLRPLSSCSATFVAEADGATFTLTDAVAVSPDATSLAWGIDAALVDENMRIDLPGAWLVAGVDDCAVTSTPFVHVAAVAFLDDARVLVSGVAAPDTWESGAFLGPALVVRESSPGSLWRVGEGMLLGGVLGHGAMPAKWFARADVQPGVELRESTGAVRTGNATESRFALVDGRGVISRAPRVWPALEPVGLHVRSMTVGPNALTFGAPVLLAGPEVTAAIPIVGSRRFLLRHARGLLLVE